MLKGIYSAASGMLAIERQKDLLSNNLANVDTDGFREDHAVIEAFPEMLKYRLDQSGSRPLGAMGAGSQVAYTDTNFRAGPMRETNNPLDLALEGPGFFAVETPNGVRYTRQGHFTLNQEGQVVTTEGYFLLNQEGEPIEIQGELSIFFDEEGFLQQGEELYDQIQVVDFPETSHLVKEGDTLFMPEEEAGEPELAEDTLVRQGFLEGSNVNMIGTLTEMIHQTRIYQAQMKMVQAQDETLEKAVNQVGQA